jgi:hypothetical protein
MSSQVRERISLSNLRASRASRLPLGLSIGELIAALLALAALVFAVVYYFTALRPEQARLRTLEDELARQGRELVATVPPDSPGTNTADKVREALESLATFKNRYLRPLSSGRIALINEINALARKHNVQLTSGIDMPVEKGATGNDKDSSKRKKKSEDFLSVYPRMNMHFTAFGQYDTLRKFIDDLENSQQFLVIHLVSLTMQEDKSSSKRGRSVGSGLAMAVDVAAYFRPQSQ